MTQEKLLPVRELCLQSERNGLLTYAKDRFFQTVDKTLLVSTPEAFFLFWVQKVCT